FGKAGQRNLNGERFVIAWKNTGGEGCWRMGKEKGVALRPTSWGGGNRDDSGVPPHLFGGCPSISLVHVFALERLGFREGAFCVLHFLELVRDEFHAGVHEVTDRRAHGLRAARAVVDLHEEVERLQVPRGEPQRQLFRMLM